MLALLVLIAGLLSWANWPVAALPPQTKADRVVVVKSRRVLQLMRGDAVLKTYRVSLGGNPLGHKEREGDQRTPEGAYVLDTRNPRSSYHLALHVSYPAAADTARAAQLGVAAGGDIMVHGLPNRLGWIGRAHRFLDWTAGCVAVTDPEIEEIWRAVDDGTRIEIRP